MKAVTGGAARALSDIPDRVTVSLPRGFDRSPQVISYVPGFNLAVSSA